MREGDEENIAVDGSVDNVKQQYEDWIARVRVSSEGGGIPEDQTLAVLMTCIKNPEYMQKLQDASKRNTQFADKLAQVSLPIIQKASREFRMQLVRSLFSAEMSSTSASDKSAFMRGMSFATKLLTALGNNDLQGWLEKDLKPVIQQLPSAPMPPKAMMEKGQEQANNEWRLAFPRYANPLIQAMENIPETSEVKEYCQILEDVARASTRPGPEFAPEEITKLVSGFLILRVVNPKITEEMTKDLPNREKYVFFQKILQNAGNQPQEVKSDPARDPIFQPIIQHFGNKLTQIFKTKGFMQHLEEESAASHALLDHTPLVKLKKIEKYYGYAGRKHDGFEADPMEIDDETKAPIYPSLQARYTSAKGDFLKKQILISVHERLLHCQSKEEVKGYLDEFKKTDEYKLLYTAQGNGNIDRLRNSGITFFEKIGHSQLFMTDSIKALKQMEADALKNLPDKQSGLEL